MQSVETRCSEELRKVEKELSTQQEEAKQALMDVQSKTIQDRTVIDQQQAELQHQVEMSQKLVNGFLQEELQQDVPTGKDLLGYCCVSVCFSWNITSHRYVIVCSFTYI